MRSRHLLAAAGLAILACGGDDGPSAPPDGDGGTTVTVSNNLFTPSSLTVPVNTTVTWQWNSGGTAHTVTFSDLDSGSKTEGTFVRTFTAAGPFPYHCTIHPGMNGSVTVTASTTGGTGGGGPGGGGGGGGYNP
jgi:plastocyanin